MRRTISVAIGVLLVLMVGQAVRTAQPAKPGRDAQRFPGGWRVVSATNTRLDGTVVPDLYLGAHPAGLFVYEATGYMCYGSMNSDRAKWADESSGTPVELANAAEGYDSYCGTYEIDEDGRR